MTIRDPQPLPAPAGPTTNLADFPKEHIPLLLNSIICEQLLGFTRELVGNEFVWTGKGMDGEVTHELFDLVREDAVAFDMAVRFVDAQQPPMGFQITRIPAIEQRGTKAQFQAFLMRIGPGGEGVPFAQAAGYKAGATIALLVAGQLGVDIAARHRELFPGHYMEILQ